MPRSSHSQLLINQKPGSSGNRTTLPGSIAGRDRRYATNMVSVPPACTVCTFVRELLGTRSGHGGRRVDHDLTAHFVLSQVRAGPRAGSPGSRRNSVRCRLTHWTFAALLVPRFSGELPATMILCGKIAIGPEAAARGMIRSPAPARCANERDDLINCRQGRSERTALHRQNPRAWERIAEAGSDWASGTRRLSETASSPPSPKSSKLRAGMRLPKSPSSNSSKTT